MFLFILTSIKKLISKLVWTLIKLLFNLVSHILETNDKIIFEYIYIDQF